MQISSVNTFNSNNMNTQINFGSKDSKTQHNQISPNKVLAYLASLGMMASVSCSTPPSDTKALNDFAIEKNIVKKDNSIDQKRFEGIINSVFDNIQTNYKDGKLKFSAQMYYGYDTSESLVEGYIEETETPNEFNGEVLVGDNKVNCNIKVVYNGDLGKEIHLETKSKDEGINNFKITQDKDGNITFKSADTDEELDMNFTTFEKCVGCGFAGVTTLFLGFAVLAFFSQRKDGFPIKKNI